MLPKYTVTLTVTATAWYRGRPTARDVEYAVLRWLAKRDPDGLSVGRPQVRRKRPPQK